MSAPIAQRQDELDIFDLEVRTVPADGEIAKSRMKPTATPGTCNSECGLTRPGFPGC
ncbi:hypothetical protein [Sciscionella marina]|uniref:hypothetical protein n=1 Tax=Sciscionella marina TaxID=508770 RepID=UPI0012F62788|nr:hypothetical protein [Sciscionella marina]